MKRKHLLVALAVVVAVFVGVTAYAQWNISKTPEAAVRQDNAPKAEEVSKPETQVLKSGDFQDIDAVHRGSGTAKIIKTSEGTFLKFENFKVTPGPDLFVYASPNTASEGLGDFDVIGQLQSFEGEQVYNLPEGYERYKSIVIWCRSFSVTFSTADL